MNPSRHKKPSRVRFPNVERRMRNGVYVYRARVMHECQTTVGPWFEDPRAAVQDVERLRRQRREPRGPETSISTALAQVVWDGRRRCLQRITIRRQLLYGAKWWAAWWEDDPLRSVTENAISSVVRDALASGREPTTILGKDLRLLNRAFDLAGVPSPVAAVRKAMKAALKQGPRADAVLSLARVQEVLRDMREKEFEHTLRGRPQQTTFRERAYHADLVELIACTGIRAGELARLTTKEIVQESGILRIPLPKDRANPRALPIGPALHPVLDRLTTRAGRGGLVMPGGMAYLSCTLAKWQKRLDEPLLHARGLRHFFATELVRRGTPITSVQYALGHRSLATTTRYAHALIGPLRESACDLAACLAGELLPSQRREAE